MPWGLNEILTIQQIFHLFMSTRRTERTRHRDDVALKRAVHDVPRALVDDEGRLAVILRVFVGLGDNPRGGV